jgi:hypothetical protein
MAKEWAERRATHVLAAWEHVGMSPEGKTDFPDIMDLWEEAIRRGIIRVVPDAHKGEADGK